MSAEPTREEITNALHLDTTISPNDAEAIRDLMKAFGANLEIVADALRPLLKTASMAVEDSVKLYKFLFPNTDGEPRAMNTRKHYPTSDPAWARKRK